MIWCILKVSHDISEIESQKYNIEENKESEE